MATSSNERVDRMISAIDIDALAEDAAAVLMDEPDRPAMSPKSMKLLRRLDKAAKQGSLTAVRRAFAALRRSGVNVKCLERQGPALYYAVKNSDVERVAYLVSKGFRSSVHEAILATESKNRAILELLLAHGWQINEQINYSSPPVLMLAVKDIDLGRWFLDHGADPNAACLLDETPLSHAVLRGPFEVIRLLFDAGGAIERGNLLHAAVWREQDDCLDVLRYLLNKGAPMNAVKYHNHPYSYAFMVAFGLGTPLNNAAGRGDWGVIEFLMENGADATIRDSCGKLPYENAQYHKHTAIAWFLREVIAIDEEEEPMGDEGSKTPPHSQTTSGLQELAELHLTAAPENR